MKTAMTYKLNLQGVVRRSTTMTTNNFNDVLERVAYLESRGLPVTSVYACADPKCNCWRRVAVRSLKKFKDMARAAQNFAAGLSYEDSHTEYKLAYQSL